VTAPDRVRALLGAPAPRTDPALLALIAAGAAEADRTRTIDPAVIDAVRRSPLMGMAATRSLGGSEADLGAVATELAAVAAACTSTAWCLWNHLSVFHLFCGALGPEHHDLLAGITRRAEWVCFPAGAGSRVFGHQRGDEIVLRGPAAFGSGARYAQWAGVAFALTEPGAAADAANLRFTVVELDQPGIEIEPTWDGASLRASSTDTIHYADVAVPASRCVPWFAANRAAALRDPALPMIDDRYREDWVGLSDLWLAAMATGVAGAALAEATAAVSGRKAIMGAAMDALVTVQANLGAAAAQLTAACRTVEGACAEVDQRLRAGTLPVEGDHQRQMATATVAIGTCRDAVDLVLRTLGGNGLRESAPFERRHRDLAAMPLHINAHPDRVFTRVGQHLLDADPSRF
jgi:indole-3-acetate monooxygenase